MVEYLDHMAPLEVFKFLKKFPEGAKTWDNKKKRKRSTYVPKKDPKVLCPINEVKCCTKDCLQENLEETHLAALRAEYLKCTTNQEKRDFFEQFMEAETKGFSCHGQHLTWKACQALFGCSTTLLQTVKETKKSRFRDATRISQVKGSTILVNKEDIIVAFLKMVEQEFDTSPNKEETYIPHAFQKTLYTKFINFWITEVEGGVGHADLFRSHLQNLISCGYGRRRCQNSSAEHIIPS